MDNQLLDEIACKPNGGKGPVTQLPQNAIPWLHALVRDTGLQLGKDVSRDNRMVAIFDIAE